MSTLLFNTDSATVSQVLRLNSETQVPACLMSYGLSAGAECYVEFTPDAGANWTRWTEDGREIKLDEKNTIIHIQYPGLYRVVKGATPNKVMVSLNHFHNI